jgi:hypothetical protein
MNDNLVLTDRPDRRTASWWSKQITVGNLMAVGAVLAGLIIAQTRAEMTDAQIAQRVGTVEARLDKGEFMRTELAVEKIDGLKIQISDVKDQIEKGFARIERAVR